MSMSKSRTISEKTTSSMTSVTSEDTSADSESDATDLYPSSNNAPSSPLNTSTDDNTDDKLTPGLNNIQISKSHRSHLPDSGHLAKVHTRNSVKRKHPVDLLQKTFMLSKAHKQYVAASGENLGMNDSDNKLSTDFSDTSSKFESASNNNNINDNTDDDEEEDDLDEEDDVPPETQTQPFLPDMASNSWHQARCFDRYWSTYGFAMEWYQQHVQAVKALSGIQEGRIQAKKSIHQASTPAKPRHDSTKTRRRNQRARKRQRAQVQRARSTSRGSKVSDGERKSEESEEMEMNITDDMMSFFAQSLKHRTERDNEKTKEDEAMTLEEKLGSEQASSHSRQPTMSAPTEQPGVRRTSEMRSLYGTGAPMVHGMETALQMSFDRITDRHQPKLWPNMPLHLVFK